MTICSHQRLPMPISMFSKYNSIKLPVPTCVRHWPCRPLFLCYCFTRKVCAHMFPYLMALEDLCPMFRNVTLFAFINQHGCPNHSNIPLSIYHFSIHQPIFHRLSARLHARCLHIQHFSFPRPVDLFTLFFHMNGWAGCGFEVPFASENCKQQ